MNVSLFTVRHVFVEFVEGMESRMRNPECGTRNPFPFSLFVENHFALTIFLCISFFNFNRILSRKSQKSS